MDTKSEGVNQMIGFGIKNPKQIGELVYVTNEKGNLIEVHSGLQLGVEFFTTSNDAFYDKHGFNFVPKGVLWEKARTKAGKM